MTSNSSHKPRWQERLADMAWTGAANMYTIFIIKHLFSWTKCFKWSKLAIMWKSNEKTKTIFWQLTMVEDRLNMIFFNECLFLRSTRVGPTGTTTNKIIFQINRKLFKIWNEIDIVNSLLFSVFVEDFVKQQSLRTETRTFCRRWHRAFLDEGIWRDHYWN